MGKYGKGTETQSKPRKALENLRKQRPERVGKVLRGHRWPIEKGWKAWNSESSNNIDKHSESVGSDEKTLNNIEKD